LSEDDAASSHWKSTSARFHSRHLISIQALSVNSVGYRDSFLGRQSYVQRGTMK
jgi:hypothetical protein